MDRGQPPAVSPKTQGDRNVVQGALRKAMLDYRSLLDTNYKHGNGQVNLFDVLSPRSYATILQRKRAYRPKPSMRFGKRSKRLLL